MIKPNWFDTLFILRPTLFFPSWTFFLAGYNRGEGPWPGLFLVWLGAAFGASFLLNQITDRKEDSLNEKLLPRWGDLISNRKIYFELGLLIVIIIIGAVLAGPELSGLLALFFLIAGVFYNFQPLRLKERPILGIASCAIGIWICFLIGARVVNVSYSIAILHGFPYAAAGVAVSLLTHIPDLRGDLKAKMRTFPAVYGKQKTALWALLFVILCVLFSAILSDYILLTAAIISLPFFLRFYYNGKKETAEFAVKISIFALALGIGLTWLPFLILIGLYYPFARWYHAKRLGLDYPRFRSRRGSQSSLSLSEADFKKAKTY